MMQIQVKIDCSNNLTQISTFNKHAPNITHGIGTLVHTGAGTEEGLEIGTITVSSPAEFGFDYWPDESAASGSDYGVLCVGVDCDSSEDYIYFYGISPLLSGEPHQIGMDVKLNGGETTTVQHPVCFIFLQVN